MFALRLPLLALLAASVHGHLGLLGPKNVSQKDAEFEHLYMDEVNGELVNIYTFNHTVTRNRVRAAPDRRPAGLTPSPPRRREPGDQPSLCRRGFSQAPTGQGLKLSGPSFPLTLLPPDAV